MLSIKIEEIVATKLLYVESICNTPPLFESQLKLALISVKFEFVIFTIPLCLEFN